MKKKLNTRSCVAGLFLSGWIIMAMFLASTSCTNTVVKNTYDTTVKKWIDWNILFPENSTLQSRTHDLGAIESFIRDSLPGLDEGLRNLKIADTSVRLTFNIRLDSCSCDSLLYNLKADLTVKGSGNSQGTIPPTTTPPGVKPGGDFAIEDNKNINKPKGSLPISFSGQRVRLNVKSVDASRLLAIIDSGLDSSLFEFTGIQQILWKGSGNLPSLRNFMSTGSSSDFSDNDQVKHGSAVAALALEAFKGKYPQLMILKAVDDNGGGSIFTVSCALSYAIQHKATVINASWGYYGKPDSVLHHYVNKAKEYTHTYIPIIAAAGNDSLPHDNNLCETRPGNMHKNLLRPGYLFYPACFSNDFESNNVISVTGLSRIDTACAYQNYSNTYVRVGVLNNNEAGKPLHPCCAFKIDYLQPGIVMEGSSFATPVVSGRITDYILHKGIRSIHDYLVGINMQVQNPMIPAVAAGLPTMKGQYIVY
jgi:Subtilase family